MMRAADLSRRNFLHTTLAAAAAGSAFLRPADRLLADESKAGESKAEGPKYKKAVKYGMIGEGNSLLEKFELIKSLGFQGVELDSPGGPNADEVAAAVEKTGIVVHGVVDSIHWETRLSDPDAAVRERGLKALLGALEDCKAYGGTTVLLVPGKVADETNENFDQVWSRSQEEVKKAVPKAKELGVQIAIEVVWNNFITKPEQLVKYVDELDEPEAVGAYFDPSNVLKFGVAPAEWIRQLGKRLLKFDFKAYDIDKWKSSGNEWAGFDAKIGEGDEDWPEVLKALDEIGYPDYSGWATAEVGAGGRDHLKDVAERMDKVLGLTAEA